MRIGEGRFEGARFVCGSGGGGLVRGVGGARGGRAGEELPTLLLILAVCYSSSDIRSER